MSLSIPSAKAPAWMSFPDWWRRRKRGGVGWGVVTTVCPQPGELKFTDTSPVPFRNPDRLGGPGGWDGVRGTGLGDAGRLYSLSLTANIFQSWSLQGKGNQSFPLHTSFSHFVHAAQGKPLGLGQSGASPTLPCLQPCYKEGWDGRVTGRTRP